MKKLFLYLILGITLLFPIKHTNHKKIQQQVSTYVNKLSYSKDKIYELLTSPSVHGYSKNAAKRALKTMPTNFKENARKKAQHYADDLFYSKEKIFQELTQPKKDHFQKEEALYALENIQVDYRENAIHLIYFYLNLGYSLSSIEEILLDKKQEGFTPEEVAYALNNY